jgi:hypothetical protein
VNAHSDSNPSPAASGYLVTPGGIMDLAEAQALTSTFGCDLGRAVEEIQTRELLRWPPQVR